MPARPRAALILPYWSFWEHAVPYALRDEREALLEQARAALAETIEIAVCGVVASREDGVALARAADAAGCEVVIAQTMASPPAFASAALDALPATPVVVWTAHRHARLGADFSHADITTEGATVGTPMLTNVLVRRGRPFALVAGRIDDVTTQERVAAAARAGAVAGGLRRARIGRVGRQIDGYDCVVADPDRLRAATGIELVAIEPAEVRERYLAVEA
jgi:L-fucose isomerase-like protein